ncbi:low molecular weight protein-tyrosine-phosphatase [Pelomonas sp. SE-A7]|uniref:low molecular weight protein-tyrosine-phosphatase n=1 Tax=Pelomonas sp. SE-A7 TaxID=3054953 RepID=UPI00259CB0A1|nr:low molecular weight protein-tyrosine-phosphatase [Pelomonas sp. SE-A7]MDM4765337.1 low molecular weight protein-tyrosine-phosphatase [Pelomonas sp. SE-A7]
MFAKPLIDRMLGRRARLQVLMVCSGNICRSPTAQAVLEKRLSELGLSDQVAVDSAGLESFHVGEAPDKRSQRHAAERGYDLSRQRARKVAASDYLRFDLILAMDKGHLAGLGKRCPVELQTKLALLLGDDEVPDPFYGGPAGFERVLDLVEPACARLADELAAKLRG